LRFKSSFRSSLSSEKQALGKNEILFKKQKMDFLTFLSVPVIIFFIGLCGIFLNRKNVLLILMSVELILLSINFSFLVASCYLDDRLGQILAIFILTVAAAESSIGLAILVVFYRIRGTIAIEFINLLKG
jgi:NADH-quinone oxidoreductase subunit K